MAEDCCNNGSNKLPSQAFRFEVDFGAKVGRATPEEVSGLERANAPIEYRADDMPDFMRRRPQGAVKPGTVTIKRVRFKDDNGLFWSWYNRFRMNQIERQTVSIWLLGAPGRGVTQWEMSGARPSKIGHCRPISNEHEVEVDMIEIAYEGIIMIVR